MNLTFSCYGISISDDMKPSNVGLEQEAQSSRQRKVSLRGRNGIKGCTNECHQYPPPIKYLHLHECDRFSVSNFFFLLDFDYLFETSGSNNLSCLFFI